MGKSNENTSYNLVKFVACIMVIIVHATAINLGDIHSNRWAISNFYNSLSRVCVPLFFMVSGALLLREDVSLSNFVRKRYIRILPPLLAWSLIYFLYPNMYGNEQPRDILSLLSSPISVHLWYLYAIIGLYLLVPFLVKIYSNSSEKILLVAIWFLGASVIPMLNNTNLMNASPSLYGFNAISGYIGYLFVGKLLSDIKPNSMTPFIISFAILFITSFATWICTVNYSYATGKFNGTFYSYLSPFVVLSSFSIYFILLNIKITSKTLSSFLSLFSSCALGIYCLQSMMINEVAYKLNFRATHEPAALWIPLVVMTTFFICLSICYLISKIKYLNRIV